MAIEPAAADHQTSDPRLTHPAFARFDGAVVLTRADWNVEPRNSLHHHATRLARWMPVLLVQPDLADRAFLVEKTEVERLSILHVGQIDGAEGARFLDGIVRKLGFKRQMVWLCHPDYVDYIERVQHLFKLCCVTETWGVPDTDRDEMAGRCYRIADLIVTTTQAAAERVVARTGRPDHCVMITDGCDHEFWRDREVSKFRRSATGRKLATFYGPIDGRIDFHLLHGLVHLLPDWDFMFCGRVDSAVAEPWTFVLDHANVRQRDEAGRERLAEIFKETHVGFLPLRVNPSADGMPLQTFEYAACGLGVVGTKAGMFQHRPDLFAVAHSPEEFAGHMVRLATERHDPAAVQRRLAAAELQSYDRKFDALVAAIDDAQARADFTDRSLNILMLYEDRYNHIMTVQEHISSLPRYSKHRFMFAPATTDFDTPEANEYPDSWSFDAYDVVIVHYSVRLAYKGAAKHALMKRLGDYDGVKMLFIQDEYDSTENTRTWLDIIGFDAIFTCVPPEHREHVYPSARFPGTDLLQTLTGYVPEDDSIERFSLPLEMRELRIAYRGRELPPNYGELGHEKYRIGVDVRRLADERGIPVDVEVAAEKRIYGTDWYRFLGSARATLGTESGANIFDFSGELLELAKSVAGQPYDEVYPKYFAAHEGPVRMNQISPKVFEAIRLRTALILFEGTYSDVVIPDLHFIALKKDYSNIDEVFQKLEDFDYLRAMTERAYDDVIRSGRYSYRAFAREFDRYIDSRIFGAARSEIIFAPIARRAQYATTFEAISYRQAWEYTLNSKILGEKFQRLQMTRLMEESQWRLLHQSDPASFPLPDYATAPDEAPDMDVVVVDAGDFAAEESAIAGATDDEGQPATFIVEHQHDGPFAPGGSMTGFARVVTRVVPPKVRGHLARSMRTALVQQEDRGGGRRWGPRRIAWRMLPRSLRAKVVSRLRSLQ